MPMVVLLAFRATPVWLVTRLRVAQALKQQKPFSSPEQEILLGLRLAAARVVEPWARFLKTTAQLTNTPSRSNRKS